jgi:nucleotide-binding universal stress UspA family protein
MYKNILVPLDGSPFGEHALPWAIKIARRSGASLTLLHVHTPLAAVYLEGAAFLDNELEDDIKAQMQSYVNTMVKRLRDAQPDLKINSLKPAVELGKLTGADYTLTRMIRPVLPYDTPPEMIPLAAAVRSVADRVDELQGQLKKEAQDYLEKTAAKLRTDGNRVSTRVDIDLHPAHAILQDVEEKSMDLIALETHGRKGLSRLFLGSVADKVIRGSRVPVLVHRAH